MPDPLTPSQEIGWSNRRADVLLPSTLISSSLQIELSDAADVALLREPGSLIGLQVPKKDAPSIWGSGPLPGLQLGSLSRIFTSVWQRNVGIFMN